MPSHNGFAAYESKKPLKKSRPRILDLQERQKSKAAVLADKESRRQSLKEITETISKDKNKQVSTRTVRCAFHKENVHSCISSKKTSHFRKKIGKFDLNGRWKEEIGLLRTGRKSSCRMNPLSLSSESLGEGQVW